MAYQGIGLDGPLNDVPHAGLHAAFYLPQPVLHIAGWVDRERQLHLLTLCRVHVCDLEVLLEQQLWEKQVREGVTQGQRGGEAQRPYLPQPQS